jgi:hypothetical protein
VLLGVGGRMDVNKLDKRILEFVTAVTLHWQRWNTSDNEVADL